MGNSTEHTAFLRLKAGIAGAAQRLDRAERQDGGRADRLADLHRRLGDGRARATRRWRPNWPRKAASVSHDGEAIYGAQMLAAMEALAFVEPDLEKLLECGLVVHPGRLG